MVALINENQAKFFDVDSDRFSSALAVTEEDTGGGTESDQFTELCLDEPFLAISTPDESKTLRLSQFNKQTSRLSAKRILKLMNRCESIRELSLSFSLLSDELLRALSSDETLRLETMRVEAHPEAKPTVNVSSETWSNFANHLPDLNFVLLSYLTEATDYESLLAPHVPLTHLYFGENAPSSVIATVGERCPRLIELVVGAYGPETMDETLFTAARGCPKLAAVGLGDCELTCSGFIKFVSICCERLQVLCISDTSLIEDSEYDIAIVSTKVSELLGKSWEPNYVPYW
ncbi:F-box/LRR-repeat protein 3-like [Phymastichus coffea]|uniref:F-box/LRR-repeat protein 3-like n=1 Tax=Phymastichus coffea TaxID=108790 RepID=UPI00273C5560|nr:F-box/LRR-repeat protein 3-like [Phymastichus coffea]XP_058798959.1 F-box/LRR-repeat protein 3-like [Phymastichus coffea]XP_058798960.1 F-box/LRR-repeat protein 3-like [Phymastichus coffea]XP_058798961.1 F-box/LRR-repeat protein 3-like [Phymastichus coffea]